MSKHQPLKIGDSIIVTGGKHYGRKGTIEAPSAKRHCYICKLDGNEIAVIQLNHFCRNSITKSTY